MMAKQQAAALAAWVNTHDDGTAQPRATVVELNMPEGPNHRVDIRSTVYMGGKAHHVETEQAYTPARARAVLGY